MRGSKVAVIAVVTGALVVLGCGAALASAAPAPRYAKVRAFCARARPHAASCLALGLLPSRAGAPGARAYLPGAGATASGPAGGLTPAQLASAYKYSPSAGGSGQTVAIVDAYDDPNVEADLGVFDSHYGLPVCTSSNGCFTKVSQNGSTTALPEADTRGWSVEISLDVETVHSVCPACKIVLVEADTEALSDLAAATNEAVSLGAGEVSNSYGALEGELGATEQAAYDHPGVVVVAAAGDSGFENWDFIASSGFAPEVPDAPASLPTVVAVGGTSLALTETGARRSESVWNDSGHPSKEEFKQFAAGGGGCSTRFAAPGWQQNLAAWAATACGSGRLDSDVSAVADPYTGFDIYDSYLFEPSFTAGWLTIGGTSLSSPLVSGLYALAGGSHGVAYPAATLYARLGVAGSFFDVTKGGNGYCDGESPTACEEPAVNELFGVIDCEGTRACDAASGYDGPTGVGAPKGTAAFAPPLPVVVTKAASSLTASTALLNASVNPKGQPVSGCSFEYGLTSGYGQTAPCAQAPGSGTSAVAVSAAVSGLSAVHTYHFRIVAANAFGTSDGKDKTFKTQ